MEPLPEWWVAGNQRSLTDSGGALVVRARREAARRVREPLRDQRPVLTADRAWGALDLGITVEVVR